jgi:magnesium transporter
VDSRAVPPALSDAAQEERFTREDLRNLWRILSPDERLEGFRLLPHDDAEDFFLSLAPTDLSSLMLQLPKNERRAWLRLLPLDDAADLIQEVPESERADLLQLLDDVTRREVTALLAYAQDAAGGLMNPRYARLRPEMTVDEAIGYCAGRRANMELLRIHAIDDASGCSSVSFRELFVAQPERTVREVMRTDVVTVRDDQDQEEVSRILAQHDLIALPVVDREGRMKGIVTFDDIVDVVQAEATEDIQKLGGMEADRRTEIAFAHAAARRLAWCCSSAMLTASAMAYFEDELARGSCLLFVPLIIRAAVTRLAGRRRRARDVAGKSARRLVPRGARELGAACAHGLLGGSASCAWSSGSRSGRSTASTRADRRDRRHQSARRGAVRTIAGRAVVPVPCGVDRPARRHRCRHAVDVSGLVIYFGSASLILSGTLL